MSIVYVLLSFLIRNVRHFNDFKSTLYKFVSCGGIFPAWSLKGFSTTYFRRDLLFLRSNRTARLAPKLSKPLVLLFCRVYLTIRHIKINTKQVISNTNFHLFIKEIIIFRGQTWIDCLIIQGNLISFVPLSSIKGKLLMFHWMWFFISAIITF